MSDSAHDFLHYQCTIAEERAANNLRDYASVALELACIGKRLAELKSQGEPLAGLQNNQAMSEREKMYAAAFYAVVGRLPTP